ncbi:MFS transporter [Allgaiera indica]|uniref:Predicted arabinose efflux permease, MFS family n=1 Tax=Allgaiera indica TaxID=765699 RepID=A0A1H2UF93_9RHOB|nr:MFS transporter [Allgaiera indica]SDW54832.1 Predicted arabinose efflux permease, MFS family [Allgaiera indica]
MPERPSLLAVFRNPAFRALWTAALLSNLGGLIQGVGASWAMTSLTDSHALVALVQASTTLPIMLFALPAGALADSFERRRIMLTAQIFMLGISALLAVVAFLGMLGPYTLLAFTFLIGCGQALNNPSWQASMGDIIGKEDLSKAVLVNSMGFNMMRSVGPAIGGAIVAAAGAAMAFAVNAVSYVMLIFALFRWHPEPARRSLPREPLGRAIGAGLRYVSMSPHLLRLMGRGFLFGVAAVSVLALLPLVARELLKTGALGYGVLLGAFGVGAILGAFSNARIRARFSNETVVRGAFAGFAVATFALGQSTLFAIDCLVLLVAGASWVLALSLFNVTVQLSTPRWVVGRALALYQTATFGGMAAGAWIWGLVAQVHGIPAALTGTSAVLVIGVLVGLRWPLEELGGLNLDPLGRFSEPMLRLDIKPQSGPIMVMVDYEIAQQDVPAFLAVMSARRRIRRRDGAQQWALLRDLENPDIWTETYHVPTWTDYVRHNERRTQADAEVYERLLALHKGPGRPRVHRMIERQTVPSEERLRLKDPTGAALGP